ncbi:MAG: hypothetical protein MK097_02625, partial [Dechloromonas sp.]|nr:hypothetical protein [Dechloromonas sp.]
MPIVDALLDEDPQVSIDLHWSDGYVDVVGQGMDLAVRQGELADSGLKACSLGGFGRVSAGGNGPAAPFGAAHRRAGISTCG